LKILLSSI